MKNVIYIITLFSILILGCEKILDDKKELNNIDNDDVWKDPTLANLFLNKIYLEALPTFGATSNLSTSDESISLRDPDEPVGDGTLFQMYGQLAITDGFGNFNDHWNNIRRMNILFEEVDNGDLDQKIKNQLKGQTYFLRAWSYWDLVKNYGGVPIITEVIDIQDTEKHMTPRSSAKECINLIVADLDSAINLLPASWESDQRGRVTRGAAAALKGRVLLFYASPQFNPDNVEQRWLNAYNTNKEALELCESDGYALFDDFSQIFLDEGNSEVIFEVLYNEEGRFHSFEDNVRPRLMANSDDALINVPNWEFVKSFPMKDGLPIKNHLEYDSNYFWRNRDPRLNATVAFNGIKWNFNELEGDRYLWSFNSNLLQVKWDRYAYENPAVASPTSFYLKKWVNTDIPRLLTSETPTDWIEIRLAEVYLNLAECAAELSGSDASKSQEAKDLLIEIRKRAGIEAGDGSYGITATTKETMIEAVLLERKIELAFEDKRHWDLRRREMYITDLGNTPRLNGQKRHGISIEFDEDYVMQLDPNIKFRYQKIQNGTDSIILNPDTAVVHFFEVILDTLPDILERHDDFFNITFNVEMDLNEINFLQPLYNFYFVPQTEMEKNRNLRQTIYWTTVEPFDPLADNE